MTARSDVDAAMMTYRDSNDQDEEEESRKKKRNTNKEVIEAKAEEVTDPEVAPADSMLKRGRSIQGSTAAAPARKRLDCELTFAQRMDWAGQIEDPLPARKREDSSEAVIIGTSVHVLGICRALVEAGMEAVAETIRPDSIKGNYFASGLTHDLLVKLDTVVASLRPLRQSEVPVKAEAPRSWKEYDDRSVLIIPSLPYTPADVALGFPPTGTTRPIRIYAIKGSGGKNRLAVKAVFDSVETRSIFLQRKNIKIYGSPAIVTKDLDRPDPKPTGHDQTVKRNPPPGRGARRGGHE